MAGIGSKTKRYPSKLTADEWVPGRKQGADTKVLRAMTASDIGNVRDRALQGFEMAGAFRRSALVAL